MATKIITDDTALQNIADAIRAKAGTTEPIAVGNMAQAITDIPSGGGSSSMAKLLSFYGYNVDITAEDWPEHGTGIKPYAFYGAVARNIYIPEGITTINDYAFASYNFFEQGTLNGGTLDLPSTITTLGKYLFYNQYHMTGMSCQLICRATTPPTATANTFSNAITLYSIKVPAASVDAYKAATGWSTVADKITAI